MQLTTEQLADLVAKQVRDGVRAELEALGLLAGAARAAVDWIDGDEAASMLGVSRDYLRRVRGLQRYGSSRAPRYRRSEVDAYLRQRAGVPFSRG